MRSTTSVPKRCVVGALLVAALLLVPHAEAQDQWRLSITPCMWATDISEDLILDDEVVGGSDYIWTAQGLLGWRFGRYRNSAVFAGYQYRELKYTKADVLEVHKTLSGPGLGLRIGF